jgi:hypothetical protein
MKVVNVSRPLLSFLLIFLVIAMLTPTACFNSETNSAQSEGLTGDRILFVTYAKSGTASLFIVNADGTGLSKLTDLANIWDVWPCVSYVWNPVLSPDKKSVAYFSSDDYLSILNIDDAEATNLMKVDLGNKDPYLAWSPDGSKIAYVNGDGDLHVVNIDGSGDRELATANGANYTFSKSVPGGWHEDQIRRPVWSSDGKLILFDDFNTPGSMSVGLSLYPMQRVEYRAVFSVNTDISDIKRPKLLHNKAVVGGSMSYGTQVMIFIYEDEDHTVLFVMNDDGKDLHALFDYSTDYPMWSPDGSIISYIWGFTLKMIDAATRKDIPLNVELEVGGYYQADDNHNTAFAVEEGNFIWSPDSQHIAYVHRKSLDEFAEIRIVRRDLSHEFLVFRLSVTDQDVALIGWVK